MVLILYEKSTTMFFFRLALCRVNVEALSDGAGQYKGDYATRTTYDHNYHHIMMIVSTIITHLVFNIEMATEFYMQRLPFHTWDPKFQ